MFVAGQLGGLALFLFYIVLQIEYVASDLRNISVVCLRYLLRPVLRFCLSHSLKIQEVFDSCKRVFLSVAEEEIRKRGDTVSMSKLSVMTGIHRPDIMRLYQGESSSSPPLNLVSRILGQWQHDSRFLGPNKKPRVLRFEGAQSEFSELVSSLSAALNPYTVLFELERLGAVERTAKGARLIMQEHIIRGDVEKSYSLVSQNIIDLLEAVDENVFTTVELPNLHLTTEYDSVGASKLEQIRHWFLKEGSAFHTKCRRFLANYDKDVNPKWQDESQARVSICTFSRIEYPYESEVKAKNTK